MAIDLCLTKGKQDLAHLRVTYHPKQFWHRAILYSLFSKRYWKNKKIKITKRDLNKLSFALNWLKDLVKHRCTELTKTDLKFFEELFIFLEIATKTSGCNFYVSY